MFKREGKEPHAGDGTVTLPARTALVAAGTTPNITYENECRGTFQLDSKKQFFQAHKATVNGDGGFHLSPILMASSPPTRATDASSPITATTTRATPATSSRRWRRRKTASRT